MQIALLVSPFFYRIQQVNFITRKCLQFFSLTQGLSSGLDSLEFPRIPRPSKSRKFFLLPRFFVSFLFFCRGYRRWMIQPNSIIFYWLSRIFSDCFFAVTCSLAALEHTNFYDAIRFQVILTTFGCTFSEQTQFSFGFFV